MKFRFRKYKEGWMVEVKKSFFHRWTHVSHWFGLREDPYYAKTPEKAREFALDEIKDIINYSFQANTPHEVK